MGGEGRIVLDAAAIAVLAALSVALSLSPAICGVESAEDMVLALNSTVSPSEYFPGSNRGGNVVGFLTSPIGDVSANLYAQTLLRIAFACIWPYLACRLFVASGTALLATLTFHAVAFLQFEDTALYVIYHSNHPYSAAIFFAVMALALLRAGALATGYRRVLAMVAAVLPAMISAFIAPNASIVLIMGLGAFAGLYLLFVVLDHFRRSTPGNGQRKPLEALVSPIIAIGVLGAALIATVWRSAYYADVHAENTRSFSSASYSELNLSPDGFVRSFASIWEMFGRALLGLEVGLVLIAIVGVALFGKHLRGPQTSRSLDLSAAAMIAGMVAVTTYFAMTSQLNHVAANAYNFRYFVYVPIFIILVISLVLGSVVARFLTTLASGAPKTAAIAFAGAAGLGALVFSGVSYAGVPAGSCTFNHGGSRWAGIGIGADREGFDAILGSYWDVWPIVFHAWQAGRDRPWTERVMPTGYRAETYQNAQSDHWMDTLLSGGKLKLLCVGEDKGEGLVGEYGFPIQCEKLIEWNRNWGIFPKLGRVLREPAPPWAAELGASAVMVVDLPDVGFGSSISPSSRGPRDGIVAGWEDQPDARLAWTIGHSSKMAFRLNCPAGSATAVTVNVEQWIGAFFAPPQQPLNVELLLNGEKIAERSYPGAELSIRGVAPAGLAQCEGANMIELRLDTPRAPSAADSANPDSRMLGLAVIDFAFDAMPAVAAAPQAEPGSAAH